MSKWVKCLSVVLALMMLMAVVPCSLSEEGTDTEPVSMEAIDLEPDIVDVPDEKTDPEPADTAPEAEPQEYSNDADILPDGGGKSDIFAKLANRGYLYLSTSGKEFTVYADSKHEAEECRVIKDGFSVLYVDGRDGDMIHVRFTDQFGKEHAGYIGIGDFTLLSDEEASDIAVAFSIPSVLVEGVEIFGTEIFVEEAEEPEPQPEEEVVITPDEEVIVPTEEQKNDEAAGDQQGVQEDAQPANAEEPKQDEPADIQPDIAPDEKQEDPVKEESNEPVASEENTVTNPECYASEPVDEVVTGSDAVLAKEETEATMEKPAEAPVEEITKEDPEVMPEEDPNEDISPEMDAEIAEGGFALVKAGNKLYNCLFEYHASAKDDTVVKILFRTLDDDGNDVYMIRYWCESMNSMDGDSVRLFADGVVSVEAVESTYEEDYSMMDIVK